MTFVFRPAAAAEEAYAWYEGQRLGLGEEFLAEVSATLARVIANPRQYPVIRRATRARSSRGSPMAFSIA